MFWNNLKLQRSSLFLKQAIKEGTCQLFFLEKLADKRGDADIAMDKFCNGLDKHLVVKKVKVLNLVPLSS